MFELVAGVILKLACFLERCLSKDVWDPSSRSYISTLGGGSSTLLLRAACPGSWIFEQNLEKIPRLKIVPGKFGIWGQNPFGFHQKSQTLRFPIV